MDRNDEHVSLLLDNLLWLKLRYEGSIRKIYMDFWSWKVRKKERKKLLEMSVAEIYNSLQLG